MSTSLVEFSDAVAEVIATAAPSVVCVGRAGSGVVVADGLVVTNAHNLRGEVAVSFEDGRVATATVAGADVDGDLAVLSVDTAGARRWPGPRTPPPWATSSSGCPGPAAGACAPVRGSSPGSDQLPWPGW